jgi:pilus assembly protein CpaE
VGRRSAGQASIELIGMLPLLLLAALAGWQLLLGAFTATSAQDAARTASRAASLGQDPAAAAQRAISSYLRSGTTATIDSNGETVTVRVKVPIVFPGLTSNSFVMSRHAQLPHGG